MDTPPNLHSSYVAEGPTQVEFCTSRNCVDMWSTIWLNPWSRILPEMLTGSQLIKKFPAFYGSRMFITAFKSARQLVRVLSQITQSIPPHPHFLKMFLYSFHLRMGIPSGLFPSDSSVVNFLCICICVHLSVCVCVCVYIYIYRLSQEECAKLGEGVCSLC